MRGILGKQAQNGRYLAGLIWMWRKISYGFFINVRFLSPTRQSGSNTAES